MTNTEEAAARQKINKMPIPTLHAGSIGKNTSEQGKP